LGRPDHRLTGPSLGPGEEGANVRRIATVVMLAVLVAACGGKPVAQPEPTPVPTPAPVPAPPPEPEPEPVELTATLTVDGDTVTVLGETNLPDGAVVVWELAETIEAFIENPDVTLRDSGGDVPSGEVTVSGGAFRLDVTGEGWGTLGLCEALPLSLGSAPGLVDILVCPGFR
jgi:hypothetical protein